ncbi:MAG: hypothetical protein ABEN55_11895 [Bradymonadaceae bacterium]
MPQISDDRSRSRFQYHLHIWSDHPATGARRLAELLATDGHLVRSLRSRGSFLTYEEVEAFKLGKDLVDTVEGEWEPEAPFFGFESLSDTEMVAILHDPHQLDEQWAVFPCLDHRFTPGELTETAVAANDGIRHHLIGGAEIGWSSGEPHLEAALEARSWRQRDVEGAVELLDHIESWELRATAERRGEIEDVGLSPQSERSVEPSAPSDGRLEAEFPIDQVIRQNFADHPSFQAWFVLQFDTDVFCVPENWRRFWMAIDLEE